MQPRESSNKYRCKLKRIEIKSFSKQLSLEKKHLPISRKPRNCSEEKKLLNFKNIIRLQSKIRKLMKSLSMSSFSKKPRDSIKCARPSGNVSSKPESIF